MGLHDSMRRLAKIAPRGPLSWPSPSGPSSSSFPQSPATALPAYSAPPALFPCTISLAVVWCPIWIQPVSALGVRPSGSLSCWCTLTPVSPGSVRRDHSMLPASISPSPRQKKRLAARVHAVLVTGSGLAGIVRRPLIWCPRIASLDNRWLEMHFKKPSYIDRTNTQPRGLWSYESSRASVCVRRRCSPSSGLISSSLNIASWTCFDPSLINNLITPRPRQLSTRHILVSHHCNIAPPSGFRLARSRYAPTICMRGTNVNTTPQFTANG